ncbi:hypothetical protein L1887_61626 [Cichorium endivia]|nr:hypothetical protein L1887_61626 [Cichorium endivia]
MRGAVPMLDACPLHNVALCSPACCTDASLRPRAFTKMRRVLGPSCCSNPPPHFPDSAQYHAGEFSQTFVYVVLGHPHISVPASSVGRASDSYYKGFRVTLGISEFKVKRTHGSHPRSSCPQSGGFSLFTSSSFLNALRDQTLQNLELVRDRSWMAGFLTHSRATEHFGEAASAAAKSRFCTLAPFSERKEPREVMKGARQQRRCGDGDIQVGPRKSSQVGLIGML